MRTAAPTCRRWCAELTIHVRACVRVARKNATTVRALSSGGGEEIRQERPRVKRDRESRAVPPLARANPHNRYTAICTLSHRKIKVDGQALPAAASSRATSRYWPVLRHHDPHVHSHGRTHISTRQMSLSFRPRVRNERCMPYLGAHSFPTSYAGQ